MKAAAIAVTLLPLYGCASLPSFDELNPLDGLFTPEPTTPVVASPANVAVPKLNASDPESVESALLEASGARKSGDLSYATRLLSQLVIALPDDPRVLSEYGKTLASRGRSDDAIAFLERAVQLSPPDWTLYSALGVAYDQKGNYRAAQTFYDRALVLQPGEPSVLNNDALSHLQAGDLDGAEKLLNQVVQDAPDYAQIAQNIELVERLKAEQMAAPEGPATPAVSPEPAPANIISKADPAPAAPAVAQNDTAGEPTPIAPPQIVAVVPPREPVVTAALEQPAAAQGTADVPMPPEMRKTYADTQTQAPPKTETATVTKGAPAKPATRDVATASAPAAKPAATPAVATAPAAKPVAQTRTALIGTYYVQAGAFNTADRAGLAVAGLEPLGARVMPGTSQGRPIFRVRIGPFRNAAQAQAAIEQVQALGRKDVLIVKEFQGA